MRLRRACLRRPLCAIIIGALLGCSPEPPPPAPEPTRAPPVTPTAARPVAARVIRRPTVPAPVERAAENGIPPPAGDEAAGDDARPVTVDTDAVPDIGKAPLRVQFEARVDAGGDGYTCAWDFGDGNTATGNPVEHEFTAPGSYTTQVRVTTDSGATASYGVGVQVDPPLDEHVDDGERLEDDY